MKNGGKRNNAGNKEGNIRPKITNQWSKEDIDDYFIWLKENYKKDSSLARFVGEQIMGKAIQPIAGDDDNPLKFVVEISEKIARKNGISKHDTSFQTK